MFSFQARFILEKCDGSLVIENKKKKDMIAELQRKGFDSDPVKAWKKIQDLQAALVRLTHLLVLSIHLLSLRHMT